MATKTGHKSHSLDVRVYYEDTDAAGVVYHANYLMFAERARTEMLRELGFAHAELLKTEGVVFAMIRVEIDYRRAARLDDELRITSEIAGMQGASFDVRQTIYRKDEVLAELKLKIACIGKNGRAVRLPEGLRRVLG